MKVKSEWFFEPWGDIRLWVFFVVIFGGGFLAKLLGWW